MQIKKVYIPLLIGAAIAVGIFIGGKLSFSDDTDRLFTANSKKDKLNRLIDYIDYEYVDDVNTDSIVDVTVNKILDNLDPHSTYIPKKDLQSVTESMQGDFVGIGVHFYMFRDSVAVSYPSEDGPAKKAGIKAGDRIVIANEDSIYGREWTDERVVKKLKGEKNTKVTLKVYRKGESELLTFNLKRGEVPLQSVDAAYMLTNNLGYIKINRFAETTYKEFKKGLDKLQDQGATKLVLDLRDNPGGFLNVTEQIVDEFLEDDKLILFTKNKKGKVDKSFATSRGDFEEGELFVLINENSASASEIVAGALQDNDKGIILGRRSYGKGLVQREMALGDGSAVRLTVSRYYTPTGRSIQRSYDKGNKSYHRDYYKRRSNGELSNENRIEVADSLKFTTPKGKVVYGGGGIIPDIFVPIDKKRNNDTVESLLVSGFVENFMFKELDKNRSVYDGISQEEFINNFEFDDAILERFDKYVNDKLTYKFTFYAYNDEVKLYLKASLARQLFGTEEVYTQIANKGDKMIDKVKNLIETERIKD